MMKVTISGPTGCGKTTLALALHEFLACRGFADVIVVDDDIHDAVEQGAHELQDRRMEAIKARGVLIETTQTTKEG